MWQGRREKRGPRRTFEPFEGLFWVCLVLVRVRGWRFAAHRSAVDVMRGKPASDKSPRKESEPNEGKERPSIYDASVSFDGDRPPHEKMVC